MHLGLAIVVFGVGVEAAGMASTLSILSEKIEKKTKYSSARIPRDFPYRIDKEGCILYEKPSGSRGRARRALTKRVKIICVSMLFTFSVQSVELNPQINTSELKICFAKKLQFL